MDSQYPYRSGNAHIGWKNDVLLVYYHTRWIGNHQGSVAAAFDTTTGKMIYSRNWQGSHAFGSCMIPTEYGFAAIQMGDATARGINFNSYYIGDPQNFHSDYLGKINAKVTKANWVYFDSLTINNKGYHKADVKHRLYIDISPKYRNVLIQMILDELTKEDMSFKFKAFCGKDQTDTIVMFIDSDENLLKNIDIVNKCFRKMSVKYPNDFMKNINKASRRLYAVGEYLGYGFEPLRINGEKLSFTNMLDEKICRASWDKRNKIKDKIESDAKNGKIYNVGSVLKPSKEELINYSNLSYSGQANFILKYYDYFDLAYNDLFAEIKQIIREVFKKYCPSDTKLWERKKTLNVYALDDMTYALSLEDASSLLNKTPENAKNKFIRFYKDNRYYYILDENEKLALEKNCEVTIRHWRDEKKTLNVYALDDMTYALSLEDASSLLNKTPENAKNKFIRFYKDNSYYYILDENEKLALEKNCKVTIRHWEDKKKDLNVYALDDTTYAITIVDAGTLLKKTPENALNRFIKNYIDDGYYRVLYVLDENEKNILGKSYNFIIDNLVEGKGKK